MLSALIAFGVSLIVCVAFIRFPGLGRLLTRGAASPRWRMDAVPLAGGLAMGAGFGAALLILGRDLPRVGAIFGAAFLGLAVGLWDDLRAMRPATKLAGQVAVGLAMASLGLTVDLGPEAVAWIVTVAWVVVVANAVNLLDNMDAVAGGVTLVAAVTIWIWWSAGSGPVEIPAALAGAIAGFLVLNTPPAHLFMGDSGSHFLGAALAGLTLADAGRAGSAGAPSSWEVVLVPLLVLAVPLFDTALVTVERIRHRRPVWEGGNDHTSHRMVRAGLGVRATAASLSLAAALTAGAASLAAIDGPWLAGAAVAIAVVALLAWWRLAKIEV